VIFLSLYEALSPHHAPRPTAYCLSQPIAEAMRAGGFEAVAPRQADSEALLALLAV
jgi:uroporphyrinogen-III synthase